MGGEGGKRPQSPLTTCKAGPFLPAIVCVFPGPEEGVDLSRTDFISLAAGRGCRAPHPCLLSNAWRPSSQMTGSFESEAPRDPSLGGERHRPSGLQRESQVWACAELPAWSQRPPTPAAAWDPIAPSPGPGSHTCYGYWGPQGATPGPTGDRAWGLSPQHMNLQGQNPGEKGSPRPPRLQHPLQ